MLHYRELKMLLLQIFIMSILLWHSLLLFHNKQNQVSNVANLVVPNFCQDDHAPIALNIRIICDLINGCDVFCFSWNKQPVQNYFGGFSLIFFSICCQCGRPSFYYDICTFKVNVTFLRLLSLYDFLTHLCLLKSFNNGAFCPTFILSH